MTEISPDDQAARDVAAARLRSAADALDGHGSNLSETLRAWAAQVAENPWPGWGAVAQALVDGRGPTIPSDDDLTALLERWEQLLAGALGWPLGDGEMWPADEYVTGDHTPVTLAMEAAKKIASAAASGDTATTPPPVIPSPGALLLEDAAEELRESEASMGTGWRGEIADWLDSVAAAMAGGAVPADDTPDEDELLLVRLPGRKSGRVTIGHSRLPAATIVEHLIAGTDHQRITTGWPDATPGVLRVLNRLVDDLGLRAAAAVADDTPPPTYRREGPRRSGQIADPADDLAAARRAIATSRLDYPGFPLLLRRYDELAGTSGGWSARLEAVVRVLAIASACDDAFPEARTRADDEVRDALRALAGVTDAEFAAAIAGPPAPGDVVTSPRRPAAAAVVPDPEETP